MGPYTYADPRYAPTPGPDDRGCGRTGRRGDRSGGPRRSARCQPPDRVRGDLPDQGDLADRRRRDVLVRRLEHAAAADRARRAGRRLPVGRARRGAGALSRGALRASADLRHQHARVDRAACRRGWCQVGLRAAPWRAEAVGRQRERAHRRVHAPRAAPSASVPGAAVQHRVAAGQRGPGAVAGRLRRRRRRLRLHDRRAHPARPRRCAVRAEMGSAPGALPGLRGQARRRRRPRCARSARRAAVGPRAQDPAPVGVRAPATGLMSRAVGALAVGLVVAFFSVPIVALILQAPLGETASLLGRQVVQDALWVTLKTNLVANALILGVGTPAAWVLATRRFPGRGAILTLCELPLVLPPAVAGIALLSAFGAGGLDLGLPFTPWAVVLAVTFVASPFYLRQAIAAFEAVDPEMMSVARTLGASRARAFWRVALPLARSGLVAGWVLAFARGIGEFGATIIFAGSVQGRTTTLTLAVYQQLDVDIDVALALGVILLALSAGVLVSYKLIGGWRRSTLTSPAAYAASPSS